MDIFKKAVSITISIVFLCQNIVFGYTFRGSDTMLAPESFLGGIGSKRDLYGFIETFVLRSCADRLLEKYNANGEITPSDKEEEIARWIYIRGSLIQ